MKTVGIAEAKNKLSALIRYVRRGETVLITDHGRPVARLQRALLQDESTDAYLDRLEAEGIIRRGRGKLPDWFFSTDPPRAKDGASIVQAVIDERRESDR